MSLEKYRQRQEHRWSNTVKRDPEPNDQIFASMFSMDIEHVVHTREAHGKVGKCDANRK
jgi:hypothetical protein